MTANTAVLTMLRLNRIFLNSPAARISLEASSRIAQNFIPSFSNQSIWASSFPVPP